MITWDTYGLMKQKHKFLPHGGNGESRGGHEKGGEHIPHKENDHVRRRENEC